VAPADWLDDVRRVLEHVRASDAAEVEVVAPGFRLQLRRRPGRAAGITRSEAADVASETDVDGADGIVAPLTGVFYRSPSPDAPAYVEVGDRVGPETVVGLIETMKIFNEILAERTGRIAAIVADTGQLVHAGETLMTIDAVDEQGEGQATP
jgi:acetyl-CoA carboxylase biotin carboxyl carrier protein